MTLKTLAKTLPLAAVIATTSAPALSNDEIRKIDTFYLGMSLEEFKAEVEKNSR